jgi:uncharacterized membrane protein (UPF0127 family)
MQFEFDAVFVSKEGTVLHVIESMKRGSISKMVWKADGVWELPAGTVAVSGTLMGDRLEWAGA